MSNHPIQVLIVDDHALVRKGLKALLNEHEDLIVVGEAADGLSAIDLVGKLKPDVVLMDLSMPGKLNMSGIEAIQQIVINDPGSRIIVLTALENNDVFLQAVRSGAMGFLLKSVEPDELIQAIHDVYAGRPFFSLKLAWTLLQGKNDAGTNTRSAVKLSNREADVLCLLAQGKTDQQIAGELVLTEVTIRTHIGRILKKLGVRNRVQAVLYSLRSGMVSQYGANELDRDESTNFLEVTY